MAYNNYLPDDELYGESKLKGIYRVSFEIQVGSDDALSLSDVTQSLNEGFQRGFGEGFVDKVAELSVEKITKKAVKVLKVGDTVRIKENLQIKSHIYNDDSYYFVGKPTEISETITSEEATIDIVSGSIGFVNKINKDGSVEIIDLDKSITKYAEIGIDSVSIDLIVVPCLQLEKLSEEA